MPQKAAKYQSWGFSAAIIVVIMYFAMFNPTALNPVWVTTIGLMLTAIKALLGLKTGPPDEE